MQKTFDEVVLFARTGLNPRQNFKLGQGNNYYITIKNIKNNSLVIDDNTDVVNDEAIKLIHKRSQIKKGDILFASIGRMGDMYIIEEEPMVWDINESVFAFTLDTSIVRQKYFYYIFRVKSTLDYLASNSSGSTFKSIKMNQLKKMKFEIPALDKQDQIVAVLDKICNIIEMRKQELGSLDDLIKARFVEMFGDLANPECSWDKCKFVDACADKDDIKCGPFGTQLSKDEYTTSGIAVWEIPQINTAFLSEPTHFLTEEKAEQLNSYTIIPGDIAMSRKGNVGKCALFPNDYPDGIIHSDVLRIRVDRERLNPAFMVCQLHFSGFVTRQIELVSSGAIMAGVNVTKLKQIYVHVPPMDLQNQFADFVRQVDKSKVAVQKALDETQTLFDSLMQEYFG